MATINLNSQILEINKPLFSDLPFFNTQFIKSNNIKSITGSISSKKVRDIIRSTGTDYHYQFGEDGQLKNQLSSYFSDGFKDTTTLFYTYNAKGQIAVKRKSDSYSYCSYHYNYDNANNIITQTYCRDENKFDSKNKFELKKEYVIVKDSFSYLKISDEQTKKFFYNSYGKKFKEQINYYDKLGYLIEEYTKFIIGNNKKKLTYEYNENGRLFKKHIFTNIAKDKKTTEIYTYDKIGNVLDIKYFKNSTHNSTKQFLYDKKTMLLTAMIIQDIETEFVRIIKYRYTFFDGTTNFSELDKSLDSLSIPSSK
ncbi:MAG: hypothetical protein COB15_16325 [Flavobacteriales bacterium]|nr:MAG: hypothetical protein COB15_16325 [Flavobacteriales bacterium]